MINAGNEEWEMKNREKGNGKREGERKIGIGKWNRNFFLRSAAKKQHPFFNKLNQLIIKRTKAN